MAKSNYIILAKRDADDPDSPLIRIGAAWDSTTRDNKPYIWVRVDSLPLGKWDGELQLHPAKSLEG